MEEKYKNIEKAVCGFYKVSADEVYAMHKSVYPIGICKWTLMYLLYINGMKVYHIAQLFGVSSRLTSRKVAEIRDACKTDTKIKEDITAINQIISEF